jgi:hypothetical protein
VALKGYPLGALFVLVAACAVLTVAIAPLVRALSPDQVKYEWLAATVVAGAVLGLAAGGLMGLASSRSPAGGALGAGIGLVIGLVAGLMVHTPTGQLPQVALAMLIGSAAIVLVAFWMRRRE